MNETKDKLNSVFAMSSSFTRALAPTKSRSQHLVIRRSVTQQANAVCTSSEHEGEQMNDLYKVIEEYSGRQYLQIFPKIPAENSDKRLSRELPGFWKLW